MPLVGPGDYDAEIEREARSLQDVDHLKVGARSVDSTRGVDRQVSPRVGRRSLRCVRNLSPVGSCENGTSSPRMEGAETVAITRQILTWVAWVGPVAGVRSFRPSTSAGIAGTPRGLRGRAEEDHGEEAHAHEPFGRASAAL